MKILLVDDEIEMADALVFSPASWHVINDAISGLEA
jgi:hypothetical protein